MIPAAEALHLQTAGLSPSDADAATSLLQEIEVHVRKHMRRPGCIVPLDPSRVNPSIAVEIERRCRLAGWHAEFQQTAERSSLVGAGNRQTVTGFQLALRPRDEAYMEADAASASRLNGLARSP